MRHVGADNRGIGAAAFHQLAVAVALAGVGPLGLGVAQQHQAAHRVNVASLTNPVWYGGNEPLT